MCPLNSRVLFHNTGMGRIFPFVYCSVYSRIRKWGPGSRFAASTGRVPCGAGVGTVAVRARTCPQLNRRSSIATCRRRLGTSTTARARARARSCLLCTGRAGIAGAGGSLHRARVAGAVARLQLYRNNTALDKSFVCV